MKKHPNPFSDLVPKDQIQIYLHSKTGTLVTKQRIGRWVSAGEIKLIQRPRRYGGGMFTRRKWLDELIEKYSR